MKIILESHSLDDKRAEILLSEYAGTHSIPVLEYVKNTDGEAIYSHGDTMAIVQKRVLAHPPTQSSENVSRIASLLAHLHTIDSENLPEKFSWLNPAYLEREINFLTENYPEDADAAKLDLAFQELRTFRETTLASLPKGLVHGDANLDNLLFDDQGLVALIDWEEACVGIPLLDFCVAASDACYVDGVFNEELWQVFFDAYTSTRPFSDLEASALEDAMRHVGLLQAVWRYLAHRHYHPEPKKFDRYKLYWTSGLNEWKKP